MAFEGKQLKNASVANSKLATASATASASSVVVSKPDTKIDISYIPTDDPLLAKNFSYTTLTSTDVVTVPTGQAMLYVGDLDIADGTLVVEGLVHDVEQDLVNLRPWVTTVVGAGPHTLSVGKINKFDNSSNAAMVLRLPASPGEGDVVEIKEVGGSTNSVTLTTAAGTTQIESPIANSVGTSYSIGLAKCFLSYKWDAESAVWRAIHKFVPIIPTLTVSSTVTGNTTASIWTIQPVNVSSGAVTITLPNAVSGTQIIVKLVSAATYTCTITPTSGTIDGQSSISLTSNYEWASLVHNGTNWMQVS